MDPTVTAETDRKTFTANGQPFSLTEESIAHILLAEDDKEMRILLQQELCEAGYAVTSVRDGMDLCRTLAPQLAHDEKKRYDLVISDVRMPKVNGMRILAGLRQLPRLPPMILITAFGDEYLHREASELGAAAVLDKPFEIEALLAEIRKIIPADRGADEK